MRVSRRTCTALHQHRPAPPWSEDSSETGRASAQRTPHLTVPLLRTAWDVPKWRQRRGPRVTLQAPLTGPLATPPRLLTARAGERFVLANERPGFWDESNQSAGRTSRLGCAHSAREAGTGARDFSCRGPGRPPLCFPRTGRGGPRVSAEHTDERAARTERASCRGALLRIHSTSAASAERHEGRVLASGA